MKFECGERWTLYHGDARDVLPTLERVDHVITDPPYSDHVHSKSRRGDALWSGRKAITACSISRTRELGFGSLTPELRAFCAGEFARLSCRWVLAFSNVEMCSAWAADLVAAGLEYIRTLAWVKQAATPQFTGDRPAMGFETITLAHPKGRKRWNGGGKQGVYTCRIAGNQPGGDGVRVHTTQKPEHLMLALVEDFTDEGETVLDPFAGSGTTGVACLRRGRRFVGVERDDAYFDLACERLAAEAAGSTLAAKRAGQEALFR